MIDPNDRVFLVSLFDAAVAAADPEQILGQYLPSLPKGKTVVVGAGKGAAQMVAAFEKSWKGEYSGVVVTRYGYAAPCKKIKVLEAAHPVPDQSGIDASQQLLNAVKDLTQDDLVIALVCGGGSALLPAPPDGLTLKDEAALNDALLASGAPISAMNTIRKQLSMIKGGRLAQAAHPAKVVSLIVSDIPGDNPAMVASGPTVPDDTTLQDALDAIEAYGIELPEQIMDYLQNSVSVCPTPDHPAFQQDEVHIVASARLSLNAAAKMSEKAGITPIILSDAIEGEAKEVGKVLAAIARQVHETDHPFQKPCVLLSGGETTVTIKHQGGRGGRNTELLLSAALELDGQNCVTVLTADTDGIDGSEDNAGAFADGTTAKRIREAGSDPKVLLAKHDAWSAFQSIDDLFVCGPTGTNVNDFRAFLIR